MEFDAGTGGILLSGMQARWLRFSSERFVFALFSDFLERDNANIGRDDCSLHMSSLVHSGTVSAAAPRCDMHSRTATAVVGFSLEPACQRPEVHQSTISEMLLRSLMVDGHFSGEPVVMNSPDQ